MAKAHSLALRAITGFDWPAAPRFELRRVVDLDGRAAEAAAARWGWQAHGTDWRAVTQADDIDVVDIITPNDTHAAIAIDALKHGKHVLCEKPMSNALESGRAMYDAAQASGRQGVVNFVYRVWPAIEQAKRLIAEGALGEVRLFDGHFFQDYALDPAMPFQWRHRRAVSGGGAFGDIGAHIADIARYLVGDVSRVAARARRFNQRRPVAPGSSESVAVDVDDATMTVVEFASGALGTIHASWAATGHKTDLGFTVIGSRGALRFTWERSNELHFFDQDDPVDRGGFRNIVLSGHHPGAEHFWFAPGQGMGYGEAFVLVVRRLARAILNGEPASPSFEDGLRCLEFVQAANQASESDGWVELTPYRGAAR
jgi:predicted dehydrogenase